MTIFRCGVTFDNDEDPFSSNLICDGTAGVDPELLNMTTPEFMPPAPPEPGVHFETKGGESKLKRNKSSRKSRRQVNEFLLANIENNPANEILKKILVNKNYI